MPGELREHLGADPEVLTSLLGQRVAFAGRLASMSRSDGERLVLRAKGRVSAGVDARTTMLVVGMGGWPLMESGHVSTRLVQAERLRAAGRPLRILSESAFREMLGLDAPAALAPKSLTAQQVGDALGVDAKMLQRWELCGLVRSHHGLFDFRDLVSLKTVVALVARGVSPMTIRSSLTALGAILPGVECPLAQLNILVSTSGALVAELEGALLSPDGQLEFRFDGPPGEEHRRPLPLDPGRSLSAAQWLERGLEREESGDFEGAERAYRQASALAPHDAAPSFNLGNVFLARQDHASAIEHYERCLALDPAHAQAWFNLAHVHDARADAPAALRALRRAIAADPAYADAYFNLAELAERLGERSVAVGAWTEYLRLDPAGEWGEEARRRLIILRERGASAWA
ncbi:MAG: tetratricopeptide repeat protein [Phycisphaerales bacterium]